MFYFYSEYTHTHIYIYIPIMHRGLPWGSTISILIPIMPRELPWIIEKSRGEWRHKGCFYLSKCTKTNTSSFCKAKINECKKLLEILATYEQASRQQINRDKTNSIFQQIYLPTDASFNTRDFWSTRGQTI